MLSLVYGYSTVKFINLVVNRTDFDAEMRKSSFLNFEISGINNVFTIIGIALTFTAMRAVSFTIYS